MVDEFSRFARLPLARLEVADLNEVVRHAVALYDDRLDGVTMETELDPELAGGDVGHRTTAARVCEPDR